MIITNSWLSYTLQNFKEKYHSIENLDSSINRSLLMRRKVSALSESGLLALGFPKRFEGPGLSSIEQCLAIEEVAKIDPSLAWVLMVGIDGGLFSNYLPPNSFETIYNKRTDHLFAGVLRPSGIGVQVKTGYKITGSWKMASGVLWANKLFAGFKTKDDGQIRIALIPSELATIQNDWNSAGLPHSGTASFKLENVFVENSSTFSWKDYRRAVGISAAPDLQMLKVPAVALGACRAALDYSRKTFTTHPPNNYFPSTDYIDFNIGNSEMRYYAARSSVYNSLSERLSLLSDGVSFDSFTPDQKINTVLARAFAMRESREIVRSLHDLHIEAYGTEDKKLSHWLLDLETMNQHFLCGNISIASAGALSLHHSPQNHLVMGIV